MREDELSTVRTLNTYMGLMTTLIKQHHGRVVDSPGDNILAESPAWWTGCKPRWRQKELKTRNARLPRHRRMEFRIGMNLGDVIVEENWIYGDGVNIAARLEAMADPGGICISRTAYDQIEDKLPFAYEYLEEKPVKNVSEPVPAYKVMIEPELSQPPEGEEVDGRSLQKGMERRDRRGQRVRRPPQDTRRERSKTARRHHPSASASRP